MQKTALKWHGGKSYLASKIIDLLPPRDGERPWHLWREPFFGGGAVTLALDPEGLSEAVNDLNLDLTNFWNAISLHCDFVVFKQMVESTPFSENTYRDAIERLSQPPVSSFGSGYADDFMERAVAFFVLNRQSRQGLMKDFATPTRRLRRGMNENVSAWLSAVEGLPEIHERLKRIEVRNMDACDFIRRYDDPEAVFYCDPPYMHSTRSVPDAYRHEMTVEQHADLLVTLKTIEGRFLLSGYPSEMYTDAAELYGWRCHAIEIDNKSSSKRVKDKKTECVWMNY